MHCTFVLQNGGRVGAAPCKLQESDIRRAKNKDMMTVETSEHGEMLTPRMAPPVVHGFTSDPEKRK